VVFETSGTASPPTQRDVSEDVNLQLTSVAIASTDAQPE
jgi:hypothetical protein